MRVVHLLNEWLPLTQTWLASAIRCLPPTVASTIVHRRLTRDPLAPPAELVHVPTLARGVAARAIDTLLPGFEAERLARRVAPLAPDVLHAHFGPSGWDARIAARRTGAPFVVSFYGLDADGLPRGSRKWRGRYRRIFDEAELVLALGPWMADRLAGHGADPRRSAIHHLGVRVADLAFRPRAWDGHRPVRVLIASSFRAKKGIPLAIEALAEVRRRIPIKVTLVGDASANPREQREKQRILDAIRRVGMTDAVARLGFVAHPDLLALALDHDILLAPSLTAPDGDTEGTPMTLVELAASGIMVVATRHADIPEVVADEETGYLGTEGDLESLVEAIDRCAASAERWPAIGAAARSHISRDFDAVTQGQRLAEHYRRLAQ